MRGRLPSTGLQSRDDLPRPRLAKRGEPPCHGAQPYRPGAFDMAYGIARLPPDPARAKSERTDSSIATKPKLKELALSTSPCTYAVQETGQGILQRPPASPTQLHASCQRLLRPASRNPLYRVEAMSAESPVNSIFALPVFERSCNSVGCPSVLVGGPHELLASLIQVPAGGRIEVMFLREPSGAPGDS